MDNSELVRVQSDVELLFGLAKGEEAASMDDVVVHPLCGIQSPLAYGATFLASKNARQKLDADEVISWSSPTGTLLSLLKAGLDAQRGNAGTITSAREQPGDREHWNTFSAQKGACQCCFALSNSMHFCVCGLHEDKPLGNPKRVKA